MIPKRIYYCWFGRGEKPKLVKQCIKSWHEQCPDYEIIEINEDNYNVDKNEYTRYFYEKENWAFLADYARLETLVENGGFYLDSDLYLFKSLEPFRNNDTVIFAQLEGKYESSFFATSKNAQCGLLREVLKDLKLGENIEHLFRKKIYQNYNILGLKEEHFTDGLTTYSGSIYETDVHLPSENTVAVHHRVQSWEGKDTGGFDFNGDFYPVTLRDYEGNSIYEDDGAACDIYLKYDCRLPIPCSTKGFFWAQEIGWANYMFNENIYRIITPMSIIVRKGQIPKELNSAWNADNVLIEYKDSEDKFKRLDSNDY